MKRRLANERREFSDRTIEDERSFSHPNFAMRSCDRNSEGMAYTVRSTLVGLCDPPAKSLTMSEEKRNASRINLTRE